MSRNDSVEAGVHINAETPRTRRNAELGQVVSALSLLSLAGRFSARLCVLCVSALR